MKTSIEIFVYLFSLICFSQVGINTITPDLSSALHIEDTDKGVLIPRVSLISTSNQSPISTSINAQEGLLVYNNAVVNDVQKGFYYWTGSSWMKLLDTNDTSTYITPWNNYASGTTSSNNANDIYMEGNVNIGTKKDLGPLTILTEDGETPVAHFSIYENARNSGFDFDLARGRGSNYNNRQPLQNGDLLGTVDFKGTTHVVSNEPVFGNFARIQSYVDGNTGVNDLPSRLEFHTTPENSTVPQLVMEVLNDGKMHFPKHTNWRTPSFADVDYAISIKSNGRLRRVDKTLLRTSPFTLQRLSPSQYQVESSHTGQTLVYHKKKEPLLKNVAISEVDNVIIGSFSEEVNKTVSVKIVKRVNDLTPLLLSNTPVYISNEKAKKAGLKKGMIYREPQGSLMIVY